MRELKICYIGWAYSIHLQRFAGWFAKRGHEVVLITDRYSPIDGIKQYEIDTQQFKNKRIAYVYNYFYFKLKSFKKVSNLVRMRKIVTVRKLIKKENPDITHLHTLWFPAQLGVFGGGTPLVVTPWNGDVIWKRNSSVLRSIFVRLSLGKAEAISTPTDYLREHCILRYGVNPDKIKVIEFGVELDKFKPSVKDERLEDELRLNDSPVVISTRNIFYNVLNIVKAIPYVIEKIPKARFIFIWPPNSPLEKELRELVDKSGISKHVRLIGSVVREKIPLYLSISDVFLSISLIDSFPQSVLEAMAMGLIPVVGDIPPLHGYLENNHNAYFVKPDDVSEIADGIVNALKIDESTRRLFIQRNLHLVNEKADFNKEMEKMERLYYQLVPGKVFDKV